MCRERTACCLKHTDGVHSRSGAWGLIPAPLPGWRILDPQERVAQSPGELSSLPAQVMQWSSKFCPSGLTGFAPGEAGWDVSCILVAAGLILTSGEEMNLLVDVWSQPAAFLFLSS